MTLIDFVWTIMYQITLFILNLFPNATMPVFTTEQSNAFIWWNTELTHWNNVLPVTHILFALIFVIGFEITLLGVKVAVFVYDKVRGSG